MVCFNAVIRITAPSQACLLNLVQPPISAYFLFRSPIVADSSVFCYNCINTPNGPRWEILGRSARGKLRTFRHSVHASMRNWYSLFFVYYVIAVKVSSCAPSFHYFLSSLHLVLDNISIIYFRFNSPVRYFNNAIIILEIFKKIQQLIY